MAENRAQFAPDDQQEDIDDLRAKGSWFEDAVLWSADWTTETIISQMKRGNIELNPRFQRRSAWTNKRKSLFIESIILGLPIPQIILAESREKGNYIVIDGKQRLLAIRQFAATDDDPFDQLVLRDLEDRPDLKGLTYAALSGDLAFRKDLDRFDNQTIRTVIIRGWEKEEYLYSVFLRINQGSVTLSPQELRQALDPGEFATFVDEVSGTSLEMRRALGLSEPDFRMRDAELLLRYFAYRYFAPEYSGNLKKFLDDTQKVFNRSWDVEKDQLAESAKQLDETLQFLRTTFSEDGYLRKWNGMAFEPRINRAVFDIMTYYFSSPEARAATGGKEAKVVAAFKQLCTNRAFLSSLETTTKSKEANRVRFAEWAAVLNNIGIPATSPF